MPQVRSTAEQLLVKNIGKAIAVEDIRKEFDRAFGKNAGDKVAIDCKYDTRPKNRKLIVELKLNLQGTIEPNTSITDLLVNSKSVPRGCSSGEIDLVGFD